MVLLRDEYKSLRTKYLDHLVRLMQVLPTMPPYNTGYHLQLK